MYVGKDVLTFDALFLSIDMTLPNAVWEYILQLPLGNNGDVHAARILESGGTLHAALMLGIETQDAYLVYLQIDHATGNRISDIFQSVEI